MRALSSAFWQTIRSGRLLWLLYGITLGLGLIAALPFYSTLLREDQQSLAFLTLLNGFDYTVFTDFMHRSGRSIAPLLSVGRWLGVLYVLLSVFFSGGILARFAYVSNVGSASAFTSGMFWQACTTYARRLLQLFFVTGLFVLVSAVIWLVLGSLVGVLLSDTLTERGFFGIGFGFFALFALTATLLLCIGDYAKINMIQMGETKPFRAFGRATRLVFRNLGKTYGLYLLLILIGTGLFGLYFLMDGAVLMSNWLSILLMLLVQQLLVFARIGLKVWSLGTAYIIYEQFPKPAPVVRPLPQEDFDNSLTLSANNTETDPLSPAD